MLRHALLLGVAALALARPETYKENEEFKYSRSSTDEGHKKGFYEAQRGNVGGNYERAHNMDTIAQGQMSDIVDQVGAQTPEVSGSNHGDVFGQSYSRGVYGNRKFDTSNLAGRNFQENAYDSSSSSLSQNSRYQHGYGNSLHSDDLHAGGQTTGLYTGRQTSGALHRNAGGLTTGALHTAGQATGSNYAYGSSRSSGYESSSHQSSATYDQGQNAGNSQLRVVPVRISVRPLQPVSLAVDAGLQQESDAYVHSAHDSRAHSHNSLVDQVEPVNTGTLVTDGGQTGAKHYESKYQYHKEWEKHSEVTPLPLAIVAPTAHLETLDERDEAWRQNHLRQSQTTGTQLNTNAHHRGVVGEKGYNSGYAYQRVAQPVANQYVVLSPTPDYVLTELKNNAQSSHSSGYSKGSRSESLSSYGAHSSQGHHSDNLSVGTSNHDALAVDANTATIGTSDPKSYASSYSYHKAWERQGDPYIIKPATGPVSQSYTNGYNTKTGSYSADDCDEHQRFRRSAYRSLTPHAHIHSYEDYGQQPEELGQQTEDLGQQTEELGKIVDLGQQTEDLGQQTENFSQQPEKLRHHEDEYEGQQIQNNHRGWQYVNPQYRRPTGGQVQAGLGNNYLGPQSPKSNKEWSNVNTQREILTGRGLSQIEEDTQSNSTINQITNLQKVDSNHVHSSHTIVSSGNKEYGTISASGGESVGPNHSEKHEGTSRQSYSQSNQESRWQQRSSRHESRQYDFNSRQDAALDEFSFNNRDGQDVYEKDKEFAPGFDHKYWKDIRDQYQKSRFGYDSHHSHQYYPGSGSTYTPSYVGLTENNNNNPKSDDFSEHSRSMFKPQTTAKTTNINKYEHLIPTDISDYNTGHGDGNNHAKDKSTPSPQQSAPETKNTVDHQEADINSGGLERNTNKTTIDVVRQDKPLRGDLGEGGVNPANTGNGDSSLNDDDKHLKELLSHAHNNKNNDDTPKYPTYTSKPRQKTPEEIEILSQRKETSTTINPTTTISSKYSETHRHHKQGRETLNENNQANIYQNEGQKIEDLNTQLLQKKPDFTSQINTQNMLDYHRSTDLKRSDVIYTQDYHNFSKNGQQDSSVNPLLLVRPDWYSVLESPSQVNSKNQNGPKVPNTEEQFPENLDQTPEKIGQETENSNLHTSGSRQKSESFGEWDHSLQSSWDKHKYRDINIYAKPTENTQDHEMSNLFGKTSQETTPKPLSRSTEKPFSTESDGITTNYKPVYISDSRYQNHHINTEYGGQISEELDQAPVDIGQQMENFDQPSMDVGQESESFSGWKQAGRSSVNHKAEDELHINKPYEMPNIGQEMEHLDQQHMDVGQQSESFSGWKQVGRSSINQKGEEELHINTPYEMPISYAAYSRYGSAGSNSTPKPLSQITTRYLSNPKHNDMPDSLSTLHHGYLSQQENTEQKGLPLEILVQVPDEIGQETENFDQEPANSKQQSETFTEWETGHSSLYKQHADMGQQAVQTEHIEDELQRSDHYTQQTEDVKPKQMVKHSEAENPQVIATFKRFGDINVPENGQLEPTKDTNTMTTASLSAESSGFWNKVGNKLNTAKDKVSCWFGKC